MSKRRRNTQNENSGPKTSRPRVLTPNLSALTETRTSALFADGYASPWRGLGALADEDAFYHTVANFFDPREQFRGSYWTFNGNFALEKFTKSVLSRRFARYQSNYPVPEPAVISAMLDTICDISRMLGILLTYHQCEASLDKDLIERNRAFQLNRNRRAMENQLARLPLPSMLKQMIFKYNRLANLSSGSPTYVGFLTVGDYDAFQELYGTVTDDSDVRSQALVELLRMYPPIGEVGLSVAQGSDIPTLIEAFINAGFKTSTTRDAYYTAVTGADHDQVAFAASGWLTTIQNGTNLYSLSRFAVPGSGNGGDDSTSWNYPAFCRFNSDSGKDAMIADLNQSFNASVASMVLPETVSDGDIVNMFSIQHNFRSEKTVGYKTVPDYHGTNGIYNLDTEWPVGAGGAGSPWPNGAQKIAAGHSMGTMTFQEDANKIHAIRLLLDDV